MMMKRIGAARWLLTAGALGIVPAAFGQSSVTLYGMVDDAITYVNNQSGHSN
jgi:predicted porin